MRLGGIAAQRVVHCLMMALVLGLMGCGLRSIDVLLQTTSTPEVVSQWAASATASSSYAYPDWSPHRATGAPEISTCVDDPRAWTSARGNGAEWLQLSYPRPVYPLAVRVHQTHGRGAVSRVVLLDLEGTPMTVWEGTDSVEPCPGVLEVRMAITSTQVSVLRIDLDESRTGTWNQIDAVELVGIP